MQNSHASIDTKLLTLIDERNLLCEHYALISASKDTIHVGCDRELTPEEINRLQLKSQRHITTQHLTTNHMLNLIDQTHYQLTYFKAQHQSLLDEDRTISLCNTLIAQAIKSRASDIHLEPQRQQLSIRLRVDGVLNPLTKLPSQHATRITSRLKVMAKLDIAEKRLPQDGRFHWQLEEQCWDCRISCCPCQFGEKIVIRILNIEQHIYSFTKLGLQPSQIDILEDCISKPQGLILVTGPTGSGKTQTLYSILQGLNKPSINIITIEDPIEIELPGITQIQTQSDIGLDFSTVLRTVLRQDPDIIMLGEIRDFETASMAIRAAHTGHLVLATLHTNSASQAITRLLNMGIVNFQMASCINCVIAQRLLRRLCPSCKQPGSTEGVNPDGCELCHHGYLGRVGVFELIPNSSLLTNIILQQDWQQLEQLQQQQKLTTLWQSAQQLILHGVTTLSEAYRVVDHD